MMRFSRRGLRLWAAGDWADCRSTRCTLVCREPGGILVRARLPATVLPTDRRGLITAWSAPVQNWCLSVELDRADLVRRADGQPRAQPTPPAPPRRPRSRRLPRQPKLSMPVTPTADLSGPRMLARWPCRNWTSRHYSGGALGGYPLSPCTSRSFAAVAVRHLTIIERRAPWR